MFKHINGPAFFAGRNVPETETDRLIALQSQVLDSLEAAEHPQYDAAESDRALRDAASTAERKAWLAIYGPLTDVVI
jgi:hypothetical protein